MMQTEMTISIENIALSIVAAGLIVLLILSVAAIAKHDNDD